MRRKVPDPAAASDPDLVAACGRGDARAWRELVNRHRRLVYAIPRSMGLQPVDADEVFQRTFVQLLGSIDRLRDPTRLDAWLAKTAKRAALRLKREARRQIGLEDRVVRNTDSAGADPGVDDALDRLREGERLRRVLETLGEPCRSLLLGLFSEPRKSYRVLAREIGLAVGSLGPIRGRCLGRLRRLLLRARSAEPAPGPDEGVGP